MSHSTTFGLGLLSVIFALVNFSTPTTQLVASAGLVVLGIAAVGFVFRTTYAYNKLLAGIEILIFLAAILIAIGVLIDVGTHWGEWQARQSMIGHAHSVTQSFANGIPGISISGPVPTSVGDLAVGGATGLITGP